MKTALELASQITFGYQCLADICRGSLFVSGKPARRDAWGYGCMENRSRVPHPLLANWGGWA